MAAEGGLTVPGEKLAILARMSIVVDNHSKIHYILDGRSDFQLFGISTLLIVLDKTFFVHYASITVAITLHFKEMKQ